MEPFTPMLRCLQIFGLAPFIVQNGQVYTNKWLTAYTRLLYALSIGICIILLNELRAKSESNMESFIIKIQKTISIIAYVTTMSESYFTRKRQMQFFMDILKANIQLENTNLLKPGVRRVLCHLALIFVIYILPQIWWICTVYYRSANVPEYLYKRSIPQLFATMRMAQLITYVLTMEHRVCQINKHFANKLSAGRSSVCIQEFEMFNDVFDINKDQLDSLNEMFGWTMLIGICSDFLCVASTIFLMMIQGGQWNQIRYRPILAPIFNIIGLTFACHFALNRVSIDGARG